MKIRVRFLLDFVNIFGQKSTELTIPPNSQLRNLVDILFDTAEKRAYIFSKNNYIKGHFLLNGVNIMGLKGLDTALKENDEVVIMPSMSGG